MNSFDPIAIDTPRFIDQVERQRHRQFAMRTGKCQITRRRQQGADLYNPFQLGCCTIRRADFRKIDFVTGRYENTCRTNLPVLDTPDLHGTVHIAILVKIQLSGCADVVNIFTVTNQF